MTMHPNAAAVKIAVPVFAVDNDADTEHPALLAGRAPA